MNKQNTLIVYHLEDNDGLFSMAVVFNWLIKVKKFKSNEIALLGADYSKLNSLTLNKLEQYARNFERVIFTDISLNNQQAMLDIFVKNFKGEFIWIDHHAPIIEFSKGNQLGKVQGLRDVRHSALYNAWVYFFKDKPMPYLFKLLSAYDSWTFEQEKIDKAYATNVNQGVTNYFQLKPQTIISFVGRIIDEGDKAVPTSLIDKLEELGKSYDESIKLYYKKIMDTSADYSWKLQVNGRKLAVVFNQGQTSSQYFECCCDEVDNVAVFKRNPNGVWTVSLYNTSDTDNFHCGDYCKKFHNGGGHKGAAGCQLSEEEFIEALKTKTF